MNNTSSSLSPIQIFALCSASSALGTLCFAPLFGNGADVSFFAAIIITAIFTAAIAAVYIRAVRSSGGRSFDSLLSDCAHTVVSRPLLFIIGILFIASASLTSFVTADTVEMYLLDETPREVVLLALLITSCIVFDAGRQYLARCCVVLLFITLIPLAILIVLSLFNIDFSELTVLAKPDGRAIIRQLPAAFLSCSGGAAFIIFVSGAQGKKHTCSAVYGIITSAAISLLLLACSVGIFTADGIGIFKYPYIEMARSVSIGTISLTERFDIILLSVMILAAIMQLAVFACCAAFCLSRAFGLRSHRCFSFLILPVIFSAAYYADIEAVFTTLVQISFRGTVVIMLAFIPILFISSLLKRKKATNA